MLDLVLSVELGFCWGFGMGLGLGLTFGLNFLPIQEIDLSGFPCFSQKNITCAIVCIFDGILNGFQLIHSTVLRWGIMNRIPLNALSVSDGC